MKIKSNGGSGSILESVSEAGPTSTVTLEVNPAMAMFSRATYSIVCINERGTDGDSLHTCACFSFNSSVISSPSSGRARASQMAEYL